MAKHPLGLLTIFCTVSLASHYRRAMRIQYLCFSSVSLSLPGALKKKTCHRESVDYHSLLYITCVPFGTSTVKQSKQQSAWQLSSQVTSGDRNMPSTTPAWNESQELTGNFEEATFVRQSSADEMTQDRRGAVSAEQLHESYLDVDAKVLIPSVRTTLPSTTLSTRHLNTRPS